MTSISKGVVSCLKIKFSCFIVKIDTIRLKSTVTVHKIEVISSSMIPNFHIIFLAIMINFSIRTTKRPVPLEHCLFYSGELYKICESEKFLPQGVKAVKEALRKKNLTAGGGSGPKQGISAAHDNARVQKRDHTSRMKHGANFSGTSRGYQNNGNGQRNWELRRADASMWLMLINKLSKKSLLPVCLLCSIYTLSKNHKRNSC